MEDVSVLKESDDSYDEIGSTSFSGASHPPEPVGMDLMRPVCVPIGQKNSMNGGPFLEDLSIHVSGIKQNTESSPICQDSDEKECVWDASLPPSGNVSPHSSIDGAGVVTSMSTGTSTYRMSDGMLSVDRNYGVTKIPLRGESLENGKTSISRASDSNGLSDNSIWSNLTGSINKLHKGNDPRWKAIHAIRSRDGLLGMSHFRLLRLLGCGDIGSVYQSELSGTRCYFAMKVMDNHQLAILATYSGDELMAVYRYFRSLAVENPFATARDNLIVAFEKNRQSYTQLHVDPKAPSVKESPVRTRGRERGKAEPGVQFKEPIIDASTDVDRATEIRQMFKAFRVYFVHLNGILFTRSSLETFGEILYVVSNALGELISSGLEEEPSFGTDAVENGLFIVILVSVLIVTLNNVKGGVEGPSYADIVQIAVLLKKKKCTRRFL